MWGKANRKELVEKEIPVSKENLQFVLEDLEKKEMKHGQMKNLTSGEEQEEREL